MQGQRLHEKALVEGIKAMGLELVNDTTWKLFKVRYIANPSGIDGESVKDMLLREC
ncbi:MAG TPA: hypothetical protein VEY51_08250 [Chondromyces sp.]|nr:hypothetical protein [Chondromyces sp.]